MLSILKQHTTTKPLALASIVLGAVSVASPAFADPYTSHTADPIDYEFRATHPFKVFVSVNDRNRNGRDKTSYIVRDRIAGLVPSYVVLVSDRRAADMTIRANELDYHLSFHVTDVDQRNKKYKKRRRYVGGQCGIHQRAYYTRITEKGVALADYKLSVRLRGSGRYTDAIRIKADEKFRHGQNLRAQTNCGVVPTAHYPNSAVARLFSQSADQKKQAIAYEVRREATNKLAHAIARNINGRSEQFYANLAAQYSYEPAYVEQRYERPRSRAGIYDRDADATYR